MDAHGRSSYTATLLYSTYNVHVHVCVTSYTACVKHAYVCFCVHLQTLCSSCIAIGCSLWFMHIQCMYMHMFLYSVMHQLLLCDVHLCSSTKRTLILSLTGGPSVPPFPRPPPGLPTTVSIAQHILPEPCLIHVYIYVYVYVCMSVLTH